MAARSQRTRFAFTVSIAVHAAAAVALTFYILVEKEIIPNPFDTVLVTPAPMATPKPRRARVRPIPKPIAMDE